MEECKETLRTPQYQPEMSAVERVYIDILVDKASNIRTVALSKIIEKCTRLPHSGVQIHNLTIEVNMVRRDQEKLKKYIPQEDVGRLRLKVCHFLCKEEFTGTPHDYQAYLNLYLMDERAHWVEVFTGHDP